MQYLPLVLFSVLCVVSLFRPTWAMVLLLVMFALKVALQAGVDVFRSESPLMNYFVAGVVLFSAVIACLRTPRPLFGHATIWLGLIVAILCWSVLSLLWSPAEASGPNRGSNIIVEGFPYFIIFVLLGPLLVSKLEDWRAVTMLMLIIGSLVAMCIVVSPEFSIRQGRIGMVLEGVQRSSPLAIAQMGGMLAIFGALSAGGRVTGLQTTIRLGAFLLGALLTLFSGTRGQAIFALITIVLFLPVSRQLKNLGSYISLVLVGGIVVVGAYFTFMYVLGQADTDRWGGDALSRAAAVRQWSAFELLGVFLESPGSWLQGLGHNAFSAIGGAGELGYVHNVYVEVLCELGIPAFVMLVLVMIRAGRSAKALFQRHREDASMRSAVAILMAMVVFQGLIGTKEGNLWSAWNFFTFMLLLIRIDMRELELGEAAMELDEDEEFGQDQEHIADESREPQAAAQPA